MTAITNLSEDDRDLIRWDVREWCDTYELYNPGRYSRDYMMQACFADLRQWTELFGSIRGACAELERRRLELPERLARAQAEEARYWHIYPRG